MSTAPTPCDNEDCQQPGTKACGKCHCAYYCSKECQRADFENHKSYCAWLTTAIAESLDISTLDEGAAVDKVAAATQCLDEERMTADGATLAAEAFSLLSELARKPANARLLGKAGACRLLAAALDRALASTSGIPLETICGGMVCMLYNTKCRARLLGESGVVESLTKALRVSIRDQNWALMRAVNECIFVLSSFSVCDKFLAAGALEMVGQCVVVAVCSEQASEACKQALLALSGLHRSNSLTRGRLSAVPGIYAALDECLHRAVALGDGASHWLTVCNAMAVLTRRDIYPDGVRAAATDRVCQNLVRVVQTVASLNADDYVRMSSPKVWVDLGHAVCCVLENLLDIGIIEAYHGGIVRKLRPVCGPMAAFLRVVNQVAAQAAKRVPYQRLQAAACNVALKLGVFPGNIPKLVQAGACEEALVMLRQGVEQAHYELQFDALMLITRLASDDNHDDGALRLATNKQACALLVESLKFLLAQENRGKNEEVDVAALLVATWGKMTVAHPPCRRFFLVAGADAVLAQAREQANADGDREAAEWFLFVKEESLVARKGKARTVFTQDVHIEVS
eukprot:jgi/Mesvir1/25613/Mv01840-RA.1